MLRDCLATAFYIISRVKQALCMSAGNRQGIIDEAASDPSEALYRQASGPLDVSIMLKCSVVYLSQVLRKQTCNMPLT